LKPAGYEERRRNLEEIGLRKLARVVKNDALSLGVQKRLIGVAELAQRTPGKVLLHPLPLVNKPAFSFVQREIIKEPLKLPEHKVPGLVH
jgi:hypothetical protein